MQYLRGVAALLVVFVHLEFQLKRLGYEGFWPQSLEGGVDLFFVISGFVIWTAASNHSGSVSDFAYRRFARIVPLYWLVTTAIVIIAFAAPQLLQSIRFDLAHVITSYLFIPYQAPDQHLIYPMLVAGWTLNYEMFFYSIFALCLLFPAQNRFCILALILVGLVAAGYFIKPQNTLFRFWSDPIILEFGYGIIIAQLLKRLPKSRMIPACCLMMAVFSWLFFATSDLYAHRAFSLGIPAFFVVLGAVTYETCSGVRYNAFGKLLGDSSYALYLTHGIILSAVLQGWRVAGLEQYPTVLFIAVSLLICVIVGIFTYLLIDKPVQGMLRSRKVLDGHRDKGAKSTV